jgi:hypothetical protein
MEFILENLTKLDVEYVILSYITDLTNLRNEFIIISRDLKKGRDYIEKYNWPLSTS